jgi:hypothetical protein
MKLPQFLIAILFMSAYAYSLWMSGIVHTPFKMVTLVPESDVVKAKGKTSQVWKYFGYLKGKKRSTVVCYLYYQKVEQCGRTTNLQYQHGIVQVHLSSLVHRVVKYPHNFEKANSLTRAVCQMIVKNMRPISVIDNVEFLNQMKEAD